jgi:hypothetical protein
MKITETTPKVTPPPRTFNIELTHNQLKLLTTIVGRSSPSDIQSTILNKRNEKLLKGMEYEDVHVMYDTFLGALAVPAP